MDRLQDIIFWLEKFGVQEGEFQLTLGLARGLSYYSGLVFEIDNPLLGTEKEVCGGGRYDNLIKELGGKSSPAVGFALGFDRIVEYMKDNNILNESLPINNDIVIIPMINKYNERFAVGYIIKISVAACTGAVPGRYRKI